MVGLVHRFEMLVAIPVGIALSPSFWTFALAVAVAAISSSILKYFFDRSAAQQKELKRIEDTMDEASTKIEAEALAREELKHMADPKRAAREKARSAVDALWGSACPLCSLPLARDEEVAVCVDCGAAYHLICAKDNKGCLKPRCDSYVYLYPSGTLMRWRRAMTQ